MPVDLADVCIALDSGSLEMHWYLDAETGRTHLVNEEYEPEEGGGPTREEIRAEPQRYRPIPAVSAAEGLRDMLDFVDSRTDPQLRESLEIALSAPRPHRRFKSVLEHVPEQRQQWFEFKQQRMERRAVEWLETLGISPR